MSSTTNEHSTRTRTWRPGFVRGKPWDPANIGVVRGYPKTEEEWQARRERQILKAKALHERGVFHRRGVPDGWSGRKDDLDAMRATAAEKARQAVQAMIRRNSLPSDDERAHMALESLMAIMLCEAEHISDRVSAARAVLKFTKGQAPRRKEDTLPAAEELVAEMLKE
ncbi:hypothetical protein M0638_23410 [Roseomonas sp. NAR14]|uniref:Uncharacterized protein n=1 Tax=Roseomonas acroporae TaxID=2937791 RepID=A0A9X1YAS7_9PROT|nr:hypothetical protein [Roseomonas acroporae]MCK8787324.1 hypothetical protein [Roseomonas acroporae]